MRAAIEVLHGMGMGARKIWKELKRQGKVISESSVNRILRKKKLRAVGIGTPQKRLGKQCLPRKRTPAIIRKVDKATDGANPATYTDMQTSLKISRATIHKILKKDLKKDVHYKVNTHALSDKQVEQRADRAPEFLKLINRGKWKYVLSLDEFYASLNNVNRQRSIYWKRKGENVPQIIKKKFKALHPKKIMFAAGICARGPTKMYSIPQNTKMNRWVFIEKVLKPIVEKDIPRLYPGEEHKVVVHFDSASSHVAEDTYQWLRDNHVNFIHKGKWLANSPDVSPMDYGAIGILKRKLFRMKATSVVGLKRHVTRLWNAFPVTTCYKIMSIWEGRVKKVVENMGYHIENM
jgi:histone H3/H4